MTSSVGKWPRRLALGWLLVVALILGHNGYLWLVQKIVPDTDILALLPVEQRDPVLQRAFTHMVDSAQQRVIVLVGADDWGQARAAADAYSAVIAKHPALFAAKSPISEQTQNDWLGPLKQNRLNLLTPEQQKLLQEKPPTFWMDTALRQLYSPFAGPKLGAWQDDPFGLFSGWVQARAQETPVRPRDGYLFVEANGRQYIMLLLTLRQSAYSMATQQAVLPLMDAAAGVARSKVPGVELISAGVILHAGAASAQASGEMSTIGVGSLLGVVLLMWLTFGALRPVGLIVLSITIGCLGAFSICWLIFGHVHLLTLVFGASLIGVAQDYGIYFLCSRAGSDKTMTSWQLLRRLLPGLMLTLTAAVIGYIGLALTPFPGLRQMAMFSVTGLVFAWLTVICWFPTLVQASTLKGTRFADWCGASRRYWPQLRLNRGTMLVAVVYGIVVVAGLARLRVNDDIRSLQTPPKVLLQDQIKLSKILDAPTPVQFYLVRGASTEQVLQREETLRQKLDPLIEQRVISGYQAMSNWTPSIRLQKANRALIERGLFGTDGPLQGLAAQIGEDHHWVTQIKARALALPAVAESGANTLTPEAFLKTATSEPSRYLWLGKIPDTNGDTYASIVALRGVNNYANLPLLKNIAGLVEGVQWVDKVSEVSTVLGDYRRYMSSVLIGAYVAIYLLLFMRYRYAGWRVILPPALASVATLAVLGLTGQPLQMFHMLALMLILGLGVDYGIFLLEKTDQKDPAGRFAWLAVCLSAVSALLSFGLLALSGTPPLHAFGFTMLVGIAIVWLIAPCFSQIDQNPTLKKGQ
ncbi:MMPL family transporter [Glaciimonas immobilis]|uniref:Putative exporter n=1 Tax=Glaciimonas immobilis TaxID=728004 RepID=A0A840RNW9_9BURK|nr:transporter [Glaciimonas immobilis]KAF3998840.1 transporter [Glaciimonas immobilis]MBB5198229.1 putative exporter [Glaciimonas immobilis]